MGKKEKGKRNTVERTKDNPRVQQNNRRFKRAKVRRQETRCLLQKKTITRKTSEGKGKRKKSDQLENNRRKKKFLQSDTKHKSKKMGTA